MSASNPITLFADQETDALETARLLATLLDAGRVTIAKHQNLINDPTKADKGFTVEVFERHLAQEFFQRTKIALDRLDQEQIPAMAKPLLARLLEESKKTIASYQVVINILGIPYKGLIPATFGTETASRFQTWSGVYMRQIAPTSLLRNTKNKPDSYEAAVFDRLTAPTSSTTTDIAFGEIVENGASARLLLPLFYSQPCLACHGEPKGQRDITGYQREGAKEGDLGGAISVKISLK
jgi:general secretion pathway protein A